MCSYKRPGISLGQTFCRIVTNAGAADRYGGRTPRRLAGLTIWTEYITSLDGMGRRMAFGRISG
jgi:hypothetical protein